jgi:hypothetical protein
MPDSKAATPDRGLAHTVANALTNVLSAVTASAAAAADKVATAAATTTDNLTTTTTTTTTPAPASANTILITRPDGTKKIEPLRCLFCAGKIED